MPERPPKTKDDLRRQMSRIAVDLQERTARRKAKGEDIAQMDSANLLDTLVKDRKGLEEIQGERPLFYEDNPQAEQKIELDKTLQEVFPPEFYTHPTIWLEAQPNIERGEDLPERKNIGELLEQDGYDSSVVKILELGNTKIVCKRVRAGAETEVSRARAAYVAGIPTPKVLGEIYDHGNHYVLYEYISGINLYAISLKPLRLRQMGLITEEECFYDVRLSTGDFFNQLTKPEQKKIIDLYHKHEQIILFNEICIALASYVLHIKDLGGLFKKIDSMYGSNNVTQVLKLVGYSSISDFKAQISIIKDYDALLAEQKRINGFFYTERHKFDVELEAEFNTILYGYDLEAEKKHIADLCAQAGIKHKDYNDRNFVLEWDFERDRPLKGEAGKAKLYLIDWE